MAIIDPNDISKPQIGSNRLGSFSSFYWRTSYMIKAFLELPDQNSKDLMYEEMFYGRIDEDNFPIYPSETALKQLRADDTLYAINFVADAWEDFRDFIEESIKVGNMVGTGTLYSSMVPLTAVENIHSFYHDWNTTMYNQFSGDFMNMVRDQKIVNFRGFTNVYIEFVDKMAESFPFTRESLILSNWCTPAISGLMIEIHSQPHDVDEFKAKLLNDINFDYVVQAAKRYGFKIDANAPWRFVADLDSSKMRAYMDTYGLDKSVAQDVLYFKGYEHDLDTFKHYLWGWYNSYVAGNPLTNVVKSKGCRDETRVYLKKRRVMTEDQALKEIPERMWVRLYLYTRAKEARKSWDQKKFDAVFKRTMQLIRLRGRDEGMKYLYKSIREDINLPFFTQKPLTEKEVNDIIKNNTSKRRGSFNY